MKSQQVKSSAGVQCSQQPRVFNNAHEAAASLRGGWKEWKEAGVQFSRFHVPGSDFALPFDPNDYLWAGPVTLKLDCRKTASAIIEEGITGAVCAKTSTY